MVDKSELGDGKAKGEAKEINQELGFILDAVSSIGDRLIESFQDAVDEAGNLNNAVDVVSKTLQRGFAADLKKTVKNTEDLVNLQVKAKQGLLKSSEVEKMKLKIQQNQAQLDAKIKIFKDAGLKIDEDAVAAQQEQIDAQVKSLANIKSNNAENVKQKSLWELTSKNITKYADKLDESGTLSEILKGNVADVLTTTRLAEVGFAMLVKSMFSGSKAINDIQKQTGLSYRESRKFAGELAIAAANSEKLFINSKELGKAFGEITKQTGLIADFGGDMLVTQATLTKQLGLSAEQAGTLSTLARIQGEDTEGVMQNTVGTINAMVKTSGVAVNVKGIIEEISNASAAIQVSLGKNPEALAAAATAAKLFGSNLAEVDKIADSLLQFESNIGAELEAELLTGRQMNLEKARLLSLNNDLEGLSKELASDGAIIEAFSTGNRLQQEAAAKALGMNRDQLAKIALQQDLNNLSAEQFKNTYGEATYESLQAQSASEKFAETLTKIQGIIGDIGIVFAPILDGFASLVGWIAESKVGMTILAGIFGTLATLSIISAISNLMLTFSMMPFGIGVPLGIAAVGGLIAMIAAAGSMINADDARYSDNKLITKNKDQINFNNQDAILLAGTNLGGGGGGTEMDYDKMALAMSKARINVTTKHDSFSANSTTAHGGNYQSDARYESKYV